MRSYRFLYHNLFFYVGAEEVEGKDPMIQFKSFGLIKRQIRKRAQGATSFGWKKSEAC